MHLSSKERYIRNELEKKKDLKNSYSKVSHQIPLMGPKRAQHSIQKIALVPEPYCLFFHNRIQDTTLKKKINVIENTGISQHFF